MRAFSYILRCADGTYYVGHTTDLHARLALHNTLARRATRRTITWTLCCVSGFPSPLHTTRAMNQASHEPEGKSVLSNQHRLLGEDTRHCALR